MELRLPHMLHLFNVFRGNDDYIDESGFGRVSNLGSNDTTILEGV